MSEALKIVGVDCKVIVSSDGGECCCNGLRM